MNKSIYIAILSKSQKVLELVFSLHNGIKKEFEIVVVSCSNLKNYNEKNCSSSIKGYNLVKAGVTIKYMVTTF